MRDALAAVEPGRKEQRGGSRWVAPLVCVALGASIVFLPMKWPCPVHVIAGVPCPTCGMTRATRLVLHGDLGAATAMHPLVWVVVPWLALLFVLETVGYLRNNA